MLVAFCLLGQKVAMASDWVTVGGNVHFGTTPVCALVLVNGQTQFSCDGTGRYDMSVPLDDNGMITVMAFADGFAPFNQIVTPEQAVEYQIDILLDQQSPTTQVTTTYEPSATEGRFIVSGTIYSGTFPVCALVLANGQNTFSCRENLGQFSLDVPLEQEGNITLMVFATGFKPYRIVTNVVLDSDQDGIKDYLDYDDDNDGIFDVDDACPLNPSLNCVTTIFADGKEWLQVSFFTNLSWNDINAVCPVDNLGACNGTLNAHDMTGWTWASATELRALFEFYGFHAPSLELVAEWHLAPGQLIGGNDSAAWPGAGWLPTSVGCPFECVYGYGGYTRDSFKVGVDAQLSGRVGLVSYGYPVLPAGYSWTANPQVEDYRPPNLGAEEIGGWFYRTP